MTSGPRRSAAHGVEVHVCRCFPIDDRRFAAFVAECETRLPPGFRDSPETLEGLIRHRYPLAAVHAQTDLAASRSLRIWYVYRDGAVMPPSPD